MMHNSGVILPGGQDVHRRGGRGINSNYEEAYDDEHEYIGQEEDGIDVGQGTRLSWATCAAILGLIIIALLVVILIVVANGWGKGSYDDEWYLASCFHSIGGCKLNGSSSSSGWHTGEGTGVVTYYEENADATNGTLYLDLHQDATAAGFVTYDDELHDKDPLEVDDEEDDQGSGGSSSASLKEQPEILRKGRKRRRKSSGGWPMASQKTKASMTKEEKKAKKAERSALKAKKSKAGGGSSGHDTGSDTSSASETDTDDEDTSDRVVLRHPLTWEKVIITTNSFGESTCKTKTMFGASFCQGYLDARDRAFRNDVDRRTGLGTLSEVFGAATLPTDSLARTMNSPAVAQKWLDNASARTKFALKCYADGFNVFLTNHPTLISPEFAIFGYFPAPWTPLDSAAAATPFALASSADRLGDELERAFAFATLGPAVASELYPGINFVDPDSTLTLAELDSVPVPPVPIPPIVASAMKSEMGELPSGVAAKMFEVHSKKLSEDEIKETLERVKNLKSLSAMRKKISKMMNPITGIHVGGGDGSNAIAIAKGLSKARQARFLNDPHLANDVPAIANRKNLNWRGNKASVSSFAGPGAVTGCNRRFCYGSAFGDVDTVDKWSIIINPLNPGQYILDGVPKDFDTRVEIIKVAGGPDVPLPVRETIFGPMVDGILGVPVPIAMQISYFVDHGRDILGSVLAIFRRNSNKAFAELVDLPSQTHTVFSQKKGKKYRVIQTGVIPIRPGFFSIFPHPGHLSASAWVGTLPKEQNPRSTNPARGYAISGNQRLWPLNFPVFLSYAPTKTAYRASRLVDLVQATAPVTKADLRDIQTDIVDNECKKILPIVLNTTCVTPGALAIQGALATYDCSYTTASGLPTVFQTLKTVALYITAIADDFGLLVSDFNAYIGAGQSREQAKELLYKMIQDENHPLWNDVTTGPVETRSVQVCKALELVPVLMASECGTPLTPPCAWGEVHKVAGNPVSGIPAFGLPPVPVHGNENTPSAFTPDLADPFNVQTAPSFRWVCDAGKPHQCSYIHSHGNSGDPSSPNFADQRADYIAGNYR